MDVQQHSDGYHIHLRGRLDGPAVTALRQALYECLGSGDEDLTVFLAEVEIRDAAVLGVLLGAHHRAARLGRRLILVEPTPALLHLIRVTRLAKVLHVRVGVKARTSHDALSRAGERSAASR